MTDYNNEKNISESKLWKILFC